MGIIAILAFVILGSLQDIFLGSFFVRFDAIASVFYSFLLSFIILQFFYILQNKRNLKTIYAKRKALFFLNLVTAISWICFFLALKYTEPAIVGAIAFSIGPALSCIYEFFKHREIKKIGLISWSSSLGIILGCFLLGYSSISGHSAFSGGESTTATLGTLLAFISGVGMTLNTYLAKHLSQSELNSQDITAFRFLLLTLVTGIWTFLIGKIYEISNLNFLFGMIGVSIFGIIIPMSLIQIGIKRVSPRLTTILLSLTPSVTLIFELLDNRLKLSAYSTGGIILVFAFSFLGLKETKEASNFSN